MNNLNFLEGNLTRGPELSSAPKETAMCKLSVACNRLFKQDQETDAGGRYFDLITWAPAHRHDILGVALFLKRLSNR
jgi:single-stranded DNA-binding protein